MNNPLAGTDPSGYCSKKTGSNVCQKATVSVGEDDKLVAAGYGQLYLDQGGDTLVKVEKVNGKAVQSNAAGANAGLKTAIAKNKGISDTGGQQQVAQNSSKQKHKFSYAVLSADLNSKYGGNDDLALEDAEKTLQDNISSAIEISEKTIDRIQENSEVTSEVIKKLFGENTPELRSELVTAYKGIVEKLKIWQKYPSDLSFHPDLLKGAEADLRANKVRLGIGYIRTSNTMRQAILIHEAAHFQKIGGIPVSDFQNYNGVKELGYKAQKETWKSPYSYAARNTAKANSYCIERFATDPKWILE